MECENGIAPVLFFIYHYADMISFGDKFNKISSFNVIIGDTMIIIYLLIATCFNLVAQLLLKKAVLGVEIKFTNFNSIVNILSNFYIWLGAISYGLSFLLYIIVLSRGELGKVALISQALTIIGVLFVSFFFFQEPLTVYKTIGILLLFLGVWFIFNNK
ncbi:undecaprenyl phosphate-alpha-L-ara4N flippase subunit ArnF [Paenibacillus sp. V4I9]|uniref:EamA family transporter n=1 Tax=Paenibacillus sp. V4I9 TaxID=3042308 RepID=UPI0027862A6C|nr:EamA family transporter [Paenibacillus sp. V4I9]MDQ0890936.1 undecaprenyl phosphate-alpha-L-ara4N flippase subunit ArnF [Paenibacillus sp. V4I9]